MCSLSAGVRRAALIAVCASVLAGCGSASDPASSTALAATAPATGPAAGQQVSRLDARLVQAAAQPPYSATIGTRTLIGNAAVSTMTGPANFNDKSMTGHFTIRTAAVGDTPASKIDIVMTTRAQYVRAVGTVSQKAGWQKVPPSGSPTIADLSGYARLLLKQGPAAIKGQETTGAVTSTRLSGDVAVEDVRTIEPNLYNRLRTAGVPSFSCDIWVDGSGRVVRLEQWLTMSGSAVHNILVISDFGPSFTQKAPTK